MSYSPTLPLMGTLSSPLLCKFEAGAKGLAAPSYARAMRVSCYPRDLISSSPTTELLTSTLPDAAWRLMRRSPPTVANESASAIIICPRSAPSGVPRLNSQALTHLRSQRSDDRAFRKAGCLVKRTPSQLPVARGKLGRAALTSTITARG